MSKSIQLEPLPFPEDALEPSISKTTIHYHYHKHHQGYVDKLNKALKEPEHESLDGLEDIIKNAEGDIYNLAAQVWNHTFYWHCLSANSGEPTDYLANYLKAGFGTVDKFIEEFTEVAVSEFGSGWAWLVFDNDSLEIISTTDAVNPISMQKQPLLTLDVWEHAYYLDYQNERKAYVDKFFKNLVNWEFVEANLRKCLDDDGKEGVKIE